MPQTDPLLNSIRLDVHIVTTPELQMQTTTLRLGDADVRLRGTAAKPTLLGRADVTEGELYFNGTKFRLERGEVSFLGPSGIRPSLDLQMTTRVRDYDITVSLTGPPDKLKLQYRSEPPLAEADIVSLLALGRTREESAQQQGNSVLGTEASNAILAGALNAAVSSRVQNLFGGSRIKIDPQGLSTVTTPARGPQVTIEQQVTNNLTVTYSTNVSQATQQIIQMEYNISRNLSELLCVIRTAWSASTCAFASARSRVALCFGQCPGVRRNSLPFPKLAMTWSSSSSAPVAFATRVCQPPWLPSCATNSSPRFCGSRPMKTILYRLGENQTISQPYIVALTLEALHLNPADRVLEIGTGSGYQTALLATLCREVVSLELHPALAHRAESTLTRLGYGNVKVIVGDGRQGYPQCAPYEAVVVAAAAAKVPTPCLISWLKPAAWSCRLALADAQQLQLISKQSGLPSSPSLKGVALPLFRRSVRRPFAG